MFGVQFLLAATTLPLSEIWSARPLFYIDAAYHWYNMKLAVNLAAFGNTIGYDPYFGAGGMSGVFHYLSGRVAALLAIVLYPLIDEVRTYKTYVFAVAVVAPIAIPVASRVLRRSPVEGLIAGLLGLCMWWVSYLHWYYTAGLVAFVGSCYLGVLLGVLTVRYLEGSGGVRTLVGLGLCGAIGLFWHPLFPVLVTLFTLVYLLINLRRLAWNRVLAVLTVVPLLSVLPNLVWIHPTLQYFGGYLADVRFQARVDVGLIVRDLLGQSTGAYGSKVYSLLLLASIWACAVPAEPGGRRKWIAFLLAAVALELFAYLGATVPVFAELLQPNRFAPAGYLLLCLPAAAGLTSMAHVCRAQTHRLLRTGAVTGIAVASLMAIVLGWEVWREVTPGSHGRYGAAPPQVASLGPHSTWLLDWLKRRTSAEERILFETSSGRVHDGAHMAGYLAYQSQREFVGGPYPGLHLTSFWDGRPFGVSISDLTVEHMAARFVLYNIGAIVVHSAAAKRYFDTMPGVQRDADHGVLRTYKVDGERSYFLRGAGRVEERGHNHLLISDIAGAEIVLKYHYVSGLVTEPPAQIDGVLLPDDPKPFVRVLNPPARLRLYVP